MRFSKRKIDWIRIFFSKKTLIQSIFRLLNHFTGLNHQMPLTHSDTRKNQAFKTLSPKRKPIQTKRKPSHTQQMPSQNKRIPLRIKQTRSRIRRMLLPNTRKRLRNKRILLLVKQMPLQTKRITFIFNL
jgi:hypothetical protein